MARAPFKTKACLRPMSLAKPPISKAPTRAPAYRQHVEAHRPSEHRRVCCRCRAELAAVLLTVIDAPREHEQR